MITPAATWLLAADEQVPEDKDVVAGWVGAVVIVGLVLAVAILCYSLVRQLRKAQAARDAGLYGDPPRTGDRPADAPDGDGSGAAPNADIDGTDHR